MPDFKSSICFSLFKKAAIPLSGPFGWLPLELGCSSGQVVLETQPLFFKFSWFSLKKAEENVSSLTIGVLEGLVLWTLDCIYKNLDITNLKHQPGNRWKATFNGIVFCRYGMGFFSFHYGLRIHACLTFQAFKSGIVLI